MTPRCVLVGPCRLLLWRIALNSQCGWSQRRELVCHLYCTTQWKAVCVIALIHGHQELISCLMSMSRQYFHHW
jgi:hypothetical protein